MGAGYTLGSAGRCLESALAGHSAVEADLRREWQPVPAAVRARDEEGPPLPQMVAQRRASLEAERERTFARCPYCAAGWPLFGNTHGTPIGVDMECHEPQILDHTGSRFA